MLKHFTLKMQRVLLLLAVLLGSASLTAVAQSTGFNQVITYGDCAGNDNTGRIYVSWYGTPNLLGLQDLNGGGQGGAVITDPDILASGAHWFTDLPAGTFGLSLIYQYSPDNNDYREVTIDQLPALSIVQATPEDICYGGAANSGEIYLEWTSVASYIEFTNGTAAGGYYEPFEDLSDGNITIPGLEAGTWTISLSDNCGQTVQTTVEIKQLDKLAIVEATPNDICFGGDAYSGSIYLEWTGDVTNINFETGPGNGGSYNEPGVDLSGGSFTIPQLEAGTWTVSLKDICGETVQTTVTIEQLPELTIVEATPNDICFGGDAYSGSIYLEWTGKAQDIFIEYYNPLTGQTTGKTISGLTENYITLSDLPATSCTITISDYCGVKVTTTVEIKQLDELRADAGEDVTVIVDADLVNSGHELMGSATGGKEPMTYYWFEGSFNNPNPNQADHVGQNWIVYPDDETTYTLLVVDDCGAESVDQVTVSVEHRDQNWVYCNPERTKVSICHLLGNGRYNQLCINLHAVPAHLKHGDEPFGGQCKKPGGGSKTKSAEIGIEADSDFNMKVYPNPFRSTATVSFTTETDSEIMVRLIDFTGREVKMLYKGNSIAGQQHTLTINSENLVHGTYFCVLQDKLGIIQTEKVVLQK